MDESSSLLQTPTDEDLEALCKLLTGVGRLLDHDKARAYMDKYFEKLLEFSRQQSQFSSRIRFLIDVRTLSGNASPCGLGTPFCCT